MIKNKAIEEIKQKVIPILKEYKISKAGIFGSYARGEQKTKSDVDILVETGQDMDLFEFVHLKLLLQKVMKKKVDLVEYELIRKELKEQILNDEIRILQ
jgi:predicted nucleotidyltransferase